MTAGIFRAARNGQEIPSVPLTPVILGTVKNNSYVNGSQSIIIPTDCDAIVVMSWGWTSGKINGFSALNFDGSGMDFQEIVTNGDNINYTVDYDVFASIITSDNAAWPGTGEKTLYWNFTQAITEGGTVVIVFLKNVDGANPIVDTDYASAVQNWTSDMAGATTYNMSFLVVADYQNRAITANINGQTVLLSAKREHSVSWVVAYKMNENYMQVTGVSNAYKGFIAFMLRGKS